MLRFDLHPKPFVDLIEDTSIPPALAGPRAISLGIVSVPAAEPTEGRARYFTRVVLGCIEA